MFNPVPPFQQLVPRRCSCGCRACDPPLVITTTSTYPTDNGYVGRHRKES